MLVLVQVAQETALQPGAWHGTDVSSGADSWRGAGGASGADGPQSLCTQGVGVPPVPPAEPGTAGASAAAAEHPDGNRSAGSVWSPAPNSEAPGAPGTVRAALGPKQPLERAQQSSAGSCPKRGAAAWSRH